MSATAFETLRWKVFDDKYQEEYIVDFGEDTVKKEHASGGWCSCREYRYRVQTIHDRLQCVHLIYATEFLTALGQPPLKVAEPTFKKEEGDVSPDNQPF
jgi:hypothetical protein